MERKQRRTEVMKVKGRKWRENEIMKGSNKEERNKGRTGEGRKRENDNKEGYK
jgi:hypothetical protein